MSRSERVRNRSRREPSPKAGERGFLRFVLTFVALVLSLDLLVWHLGRQEHLAFLDTFTAYAATTLMQLSGLPVARDSNVMQLTNSVWIVSVECTAVYLAAIYASFVLAYPAPVRAKAIALSAGLPFLFGANLLRLLALSWIDRLAPWLFAYLHGLAWQGAFVVLIIAMWAVWIEWVVNRAVTPPMAR